MLDKIFSNAIAETLSFGSTVIIILSSVILGLGISLVYIFTHKKEHYSSSFTISLIMLPAIIAMIILLVGNNVARAFSLAGAFSLIRFRSAPGDSKDISYVFFTLGVGLACGMGYIGYAVLFAVILCLVMIILTRIKFGSKKKSQLQLKIVVPEDLQFQGMFDGVLGEYTEDFRLCRVRTTQFGSLFELTYDITMKDENNVKNFIDKLRCKNGNLKISISVKESSEIAVF